MTEEQAQALRERIAALEQRMRAMDPYEQARRRCNHMDGFGVCDNCWRAAGCPRSLILTKAERDGWGQP
jgi:hypothetical protein